MTIEIMTVIRNITDSTTLARIQNTVAIGTQKGMATKAVLSAMKIEPDIHQEDEIGSTKAVAKITGAAAGKTNATKAIVKAVTAATVARAQNAATAKV